MACTESSRLSYWPPFHMLQGTPYIYQGEEIGMTNAKFPSIDNYRDIETLNMYRTLVDEKGLDSAIVMAAICAKGCDKSHTPMQWDDSANAGFTTGAPWIKVNPNYLKRGFSGCDDITISMKDRVAHKGSVFFIDIGQAAVRY